MSEKRECTLQFLQDQSGRTASVHVTQGGKAVTPPPPEPPKPEEKDLTVPVLVFNNGGEQGVTVGVLVNYYNDGLQNNIVEETLTGETGSHEIGTLRIPGGSTEIEFVPQGNSRLKYYFVDEQGLQYPLSTNGSMAPDIKSWRDKYGSFFQIHIVGGGGGHDYPTNNPE